MNRIMYFTIHLCVVLFFTACNRHNHDHSQEAHTHDHANCDHDHEHDHDHEPVAEHNHDHENPDAISFTQAQQAKIDFETAHPVMERFGQLIKSVAQIQSAQGDESNVVAKSSGMAVFENNIIEGEFVSTGQKLLTISSAGLAENNAAVRYTEALTNFQKAGAAYERARALIKDQIISQREFQETQAEYETAKVTYENLAKGFTQKGFSVNSPVSGYVRQLFVENGQFVEEGQTLFSLSKNKNLLLKAEVQPKYFSLLSNISSATIASMDKSRFYTLEELNGKFLSYGKSITGDNYLIPVTFQIDNKKDFLPGGLVDIYIKTQSEKEVMTVPASALTEEQGLYFVYVQLCSESFEKREVTIGTTDGIRTEIRSGLNMNEKIVTKGAVSVKLAQSAGALDPHAGHVH